MSTRDVEVQALPRDKLFAIKHQWSAGRYHLSVEEKLDEERAQTLLDNLRSLPNE